MLLRNRIYYRVKPLIPRLVRLALRRRHVRQIRRNCGSVWPINEAAGRKPEGWIGWPEGKQFAFVLTHDVESRRGLERVKPLAELEMSLGFRSCFNFIPEGDYRVSDELLSWLRERGFEIGVHDLHHDGQLFSSRDHFRKCAGSINRYLKEWGAVGFRAGFMHRNLDWIHDLNIAYDSSTFDTDPFEPQPEGAGTIFPFRVQNPQSCSDTGLPPSSLAPRPSSLSQGYLELPYTLPQDSTLFIYCGERNTKIWREKLDWIAQHGGMALLNVHPDYLAFGAERRGTEYSAAHYEEFLRYVKSKHQSSFWHTVPLEIAGYSKKTLSGSDHASLPRTANGSSPGGCSRRVWIDLENTPHIPFFKPIIRELEDRGHQVILSARDAYQTCEMADKYGFQYARIGHHYGKNRLMKLWGLLVRSSQLLSFARREHPYLALNHGSRTQTLICNVLRIPTVTIMDYEHTGHVPFVSSRWNIMPEVVVNGSHGRRTPRLLTYSGIKEDVYVPDFHPDPTIFRELGLSEENIIVTVRPPATEAHYHNPEAEILFERFMELAFESSGVQVVLLPRNKRQDADIRSRWPHWFGGSGKVLIPNGVVNGLNLLWASDLVVSGGGTMNREAAAMGVPVYSIFRGTIGAVDRQLQAEGRLILIERPEEIASKIELKRRPKDANQRFVTRKALTDIVGHIEKILSSPR